MTLRLNESVQEEAASSGVRRGQISRGPFVEMITCVTPFGFCFFLVLHSSLFHLVHAVWLLHLADVMRSHVDESETHHDFCYISFVVWCDAGLSRRARQNDENMIKRLGGTSGHLITSTWDKESSRMASCRSDCGLKPDGRRRAEVISLREVTTPSIRQRLPVP